MARMRRIDNLPSTGVPDRTLGLLREGYRFIPSRCERLHSDAFVTRLMLSKVLCMRGQDAAELFYSGERFTRQGAMPVTVLKLLQDRGSVQMLDDEAHRHRKRMFLSILNAEAIQVLAAHFAQEWRARLPAWERARRVVLFDELPLLLVRAVCTWAGVPVLSEADALAREQEFTAMIEATGRVGPRNWRALWLRRRSERWARDILLRIRNGSLTMHENAAAAVIARYRDLDGRLLPLEVGAVELLNILRPVVAVARFIVFSALALHEHPEWRRRFEAGETADLVNFVQEVRRISPFFPFIGGKARRTVRWRDIDIPRGQWVLLDLYGTCRDPRHWINPDVFRPERFRGQDHGLAFIPQGGGDYVESHRCPGEEATIALTAEAVRLLTRAMHYEVPAQDLTIDLACIPARPKSGFVMTGIRATA